MPIIQDDTTSRYHGQLDIEAYGKGFSETYDLKCSDGQWATAEMELYNIAILRACLLGRGARLKYAVVSEDGPARKSKVVIPNPIEGTTGVGFDLVTTNEISVKINTLATKLNLRLQTANGDYVVRGVRGPCDSWIREYKWVPTGKPLDVFEIDDADINSAWDDAEDLPGSEFFDFTKTYTPAQFAAKFFTYEKAWQKYCKALMHFTLYRRFVPGSSGSAGSYTNVEWEKIIYRGVRDRAAGLPSGR